jgi:phage repressor protein C with HTH and peptisase S24 domain
MDGELDTPGARLRWARQKAGFRTAKDAAKAARVGEVSFRAYENDQHGFSKHAIQLAKTFRVPVEWLLEGEGIPSDLTSNVDTLVSSRAEPVEIEMIRKVDITYAMGDGSVIEDYPEVEFLPFSLNFLRQFARGTTECLFLATGYGDSMEPTLRRDDLVMIDTSQGRVTLQDQIWALAYAGVGMIKRVRRLSGGRVLILSDNPSVPPQEVDEEEVHIVGKVVWSARVM